MSVTQTYILAHTARAKLSREASRPEHNLRFLVGHANMLDGLMLDLAEAEREQETWYNDSVRHATTTSSSSSPSKSAPAHIRWADQVVDSIEEEWDPSNDYSSDSSSSSSSDSESDDDSDYGQDDRFFVDVTPATTAVSAAPLLSPTPRRLDNNDVDDSRDDEDEFEDDLEEDYEELTLTRTNSHSKQQQQQQQQQPPDLLSDNEDDDESSEEDDLSPPSPPQPAFDHFSGSQGQEGEEEIVASNLYPTTTNTTSSSSAPSTGKTVVPRKPLLPESTPGQGSLLEPPGCLVSVRG